MLVGGLKPATIYWYRFTDDDGEGSRIGRTITAPRDDDARPVRFAFVSCQSVNEGAQNAYRRMIWEDERAPADQRLGFVLHLGDFIYEVVEYPEEVRAPLRPHRLRHRPIPNARKVDNFHVPTDLAGYRVVYQRAHRATPTSRTRARISRSSASATITNSRGRAGRASSSTAARPSRRSRCASPPIRRGGNISRRACARRRGRGSTVRRARRSRTRRSPSSTITASATSPTTAPRSASMTAYRALRYGRHVDLILTDLHSYTMQDPTDAARSRLRSISGDFPNMFPQEWMEILDGGRDVRRRQAAREPSRSATRPSPTSARTSRR